jgi:hypothetical protein
MRRELRIALGVMGSLVVISVRIRLGLQPELLRFAVDAPARLC